MKNAKKETQDRKVYVTIRSPAGKKEKLETWRYWEIVGALQWMGANRQQAYDAARWCIKAKPGSWYEINLVYAERDPYTMELCKTKTGKIRQEVIEDA